MNELYACEPAAIQHSSDLKLLVKSFNPFVGRYLAECPYFEDWRKSIMQNFTSMGELEQKRVSTVIHQAREKSTFIRQKGFSWNMQQTWIDNVKQLKIPTNKIVSASGEHGTTALSDLDLPVNAGERIFGNAEEFLRVSEFLIQISQELYFIDPYLHLNKENVRLVIEKLLEACAARKCTKIILVAHEPKNDHEHIIKSAEKYIGIYRKRYPLIKFKYFLLNDETSHNKFHKRYLLSIKGAIDFDKGFQQETNKNSKIEVSPVNETIHIELVKLFHENAHGMNVIYEI